MLTRNSKKYKTIMGIDSSTNNVAWTIVQNSKPKAYGIIQLAKVVGWNQKMKLVSEEFPKLLAEFKPDHIYIEKSIYVKNVATFRILSYMVGGLIALLVAEGYEFTDAEPMVRKSWMKYLRINAKFKAAAKKKLGTKEANKLCEQLRKSQTQRVLEFNFPDFDAADDNISDSCGLALYGYNQLSKEIKLRTDRDIALDTARLRELGLLQLL